MENLLCVKTSLDILKAFNQYRFAKVLNTNGNLITDSIARELSKLNLDRICVTIDGSKSMYTIVNEEKEVLRKLLRELKIYNDITYLYQHYLP